MATTLRFRIPSSIAPAVSPAWSTVWDGPAGGTVKRYQLSTTPLPTNTYQASTQGQGATTNTGPNRYMAQGVSAGILPAGPINGTFTGVEYCTKYDSAATGRLRVIVRVFSADGATERGVIYDGVTADITTVGISGRSVRKFGGSLTPGITAEEGDRLVVDVGAVIDQYTTASNRIIYMGNIDSTSRAVDLPYADDDTTYAASTSLSPWFELALTDPPTPPDPAEAADYPQMGDLRLEVEQPAGDTLHNKILNPAGDAGGYGWISDPLNPRAPETTVTGDGILHFSATGNATPGIGDPDISALSVPFAVTPGQYVAANVLPNSSSNVTDWIIVAIVVFDATGAVVPGSGASTTYDQDSGPGTYAHINPYQIPAGAVSAALRINAPVTPGQVGVVSLNRVDVALADTSTKLAADFPAGASTALTSASYTDIIGSAVTATITRQDLNVAELSATIKDVALDPATTDLLRPGRGIRLSANTSTDPDTPAWDRLFTGQIDDTPTVYDYTVTGPKRATISLHAVDAVTALANTAAPNGYGELSQLASVLEVVGTVPWNISGAGTGHVLNQAPITTNPDATALDQIVIARDSNHAYAWVTRDGILNVHTAEDLPTYTGLETITLSEADYDAAGPVVTWDLEEVINDITITHVVRNAITGETAEVTWGPYQDLASAQEWGVRHRDITVAGLVNDAATMQAYAAAIFAANAQPAVRVKEVTLPIRAASDRPWVKAMTDLYAPVYLTNTDAGLGQLVRVTSLTHTIRPGEWDLTLGFSVDGGSPVATTPSTTPAVPAGAATIGVTTPEAPHYEAIKAADQNVPTGTNTVIAGWSTIVTNVGGIEVAAGVATVPRAGRYLITTSLGYGGATGGRRYAAITKNGTETYNTSAWPADTAPCRLNLAGVLTLAAGDQIAISAQQTSGATLAVLAGAYLALTYL